MLDLIKITMVLIVMIVLISRKINLAYALLAGTILTGLFFGRGYLILNDLLESIISPETLNLVIVFFFVFYLSNLLSDAGLLKDLLVSLERLMKEARLVIISIPFIIGLVPAPSGAMLSAPFVDEIGNKVGLLPERKLIINYWFRHVTEYINPIYPGPILSVAILGITFAELFVINLPVMLFVLITGFFLYAFQIRISKNQDKASKRDIYNIVKGLWPILFTLMLPIVFKTSLALSLAIAIVLVIITNRIKKEKLGDLFKKSLKIDIFLTLFCIMFFKAVLENSNAIGKISASVIALGLPKATLIIAIPLLIGFLTGMTIAYVGLGFPILLPFLNSGSGLELSSVMLAYVSGYLGVLLSPTHLCLSVTQQYFKADYSKVYRLLVPGLAILFAFTLALFFLGWPNL